MLNNLPSLLLLIFIVVPAGVFADANDGEFMGYRLNDEYPMTPDTRATQSLNGNLLVVAEHPVTPADIGEVRITSTVESHTIGFIEASQTFTTESEARQFAKKYYELLHAKYPDWNIDAGRIQLDEQTLMPTALIMQKWPHTLRMNLTRGNAQNARPFQIALTLRFQFDSPQRKTWDSLARKEQGEMQNANKELLLDESDTRGL